MTAKVPPKFEDAPGIVVRARKTGWVAFWQARSDLAERGWKPVTVPLWRGEEPTLIDRSYVSDSCKLMQAEMLIWGRGGLPEASAYDGTIGSLIRCFQTDPDSPFRKTRYGTRAHYMSVMNRIERDHGSEYVKDLRGRDMLRWHEDWSAKGRIPMAHALIRMVRGLLGYGMTLLECDECSRMCAVLSKQRFKMGKPRSSTLTAEQATAIRAQAHAEGFRSIALAQAIQFDCMLRQKDVIGEWVPEGEPGLSDVMLAKEKWLWGARWNEVDETLKLRHVTSKRQKPVEKDLRLRPMVVEELNLRYPGSVVVNEGTLAVTVNRHLLPASGPIVIEERTGLPYRAHQFRKLWRKLARAAGVPDAVRNMDSRAGSITEALAAGARLQAVRKAATHSSEDMTQRYSRGDAEEDAEVAQLVAAHRKNKSGT